MYIGISFRFFSLNIISNGFGIFTSALHYFILFYFILSYFMNFSFLLTNHNNGRFSNGGTRDMMRRCLFGETNALSTPRRLKRHTILFCDEEGKWMKIPLSSAVFGDIDRRRCGLGLGAAVVRGFRRKRNRTRARTIKRIIISHHFLTRSFSHTLSLFAEC